MSEPQDKVAELSALLENARQDVAFWRDEATKLRGERNSMGRDLYAVTEQREALRQQLHTNPCAHCFRGYPESAIAAGRQHSAPATSLPPAPETAPRPPAVTDRPASQGVDSEDGGGQELSREQIDAECADAIGKLEWLRNRTCGQDTAIKFFYAARNLARDGSKPYTIFQARKKLAAAYVVLNQRNERTE